MAQTKLAQTKLAQTKPASKRSGRSKAMPVLGAAGLSLTLASAASADIARPAAEMTTRLAAVAHEITLAEEDMSDVSLATFRIVDRENAGALPRGPLLAMGAGCGCGGCAGCGGCWTGTNYTEPLIKSGGCGYARPVRPARNYVHAVKRPRG
jgi:hypothetical protein